MIYNRKQAIIRHKSHKWFGSFDACEVYFRCLSKIELGTKIEMYVSYYAFSNEPTGAVAVCDVVGKELGYDVAYKPFGFRLLLGSDILIHGGMWNIKEASPQYGSESKFISLDLSAYKYAWWLMSPNDGLARRIIKTK